MHNTLTLQEAFDRMVLHLAAQGRRGSSDTNGQGCVYRAVNGDRCAVGALIPDEAFDTWECLQDELERNVTDIEDLDEAVTGLYNEHPELLIAARIDVDLVDGGQDVQDMHDFLSHAQEIHDNGYCGANRPDGIVEQELREDTIVSNWPLWFDALGRWYGLNTESVQIAFGTVKVPDLTLIESR